MTLSAILDDCLRRLQAGESVAACLERYPEQADELAPLLAAAARLRPLAELRLPDGARAVGREALRVAARERAARATQRARRPGWSMASGRAFGGVATALVALLVLALAATTVLASQPGDAGYALRVVAERAPAALQVSSVGRAAVELRVADRRLADLESYLGATQRVEAAALAALLRGDEAAARRAMALPQAERVRVAERIERHADAVFRLAARAESQAGADRLMQVAHRMEDIAARLRLGLPLPARRRDAESTAPGGNPTLPPAAATPTPTETQPVGPVDAPGQGATAPSTATSTPQDTPAPPTEPPATESPVPPSATRPPSPTHTVEPSATSTPAATVPRATVAATSLPRPTRTPWPTLTPRPTRTPWPTLTPRPTRTPWPTLTPRPTRTPWPTLTPRPTRTPWPTLTPRPTRTPWPTLTPRPTRTPKPTQTPGPLQTAEPHGTSLPTPRQTAGPKTPNAGTPAASPTAAATPPYGSGLPTPPPNGSSTRQP